MVRVVFELVGQVADCLAVDVQLAQYVGKVFIGKIVIEKILNIIQILTRILRVKCDYQLKLI